MPRFALVTATALVLVAIVAGWGRPLTLGSDFSAFYCAGLAIDRHADPYRAEPLGTCERRETMTPPPEGVTRPAPLPPYALAPFVLLARLPYVWALGLWSLAIVVASAAAVFAMSRITGIPLLGVGAAFFISTLVALELGQIAAFATAGIALSASFARFGKDRLAALAAAAAMVEPHVALAACLALFVWRPKTRIVLGLAAIACVALSFWLGGPRLVFEYVRDVLPSHALSEVGVWFQFSLSYLLHQLGVAAEPAVRVGELWYGAMLILGVALAGRFARTKAELIPALPVVFTVFGGAFVHSLQIIAAIPAALILWSDAPTERMQKALAIGVLLVALPLVEFNSPWRLWLPLYAAAALILAATLLRASPLASLACGFVAGAVPFTLLKTIRFLPWPSLAPLVAVYDPHALAEVSWARYMNLMSTAIPPRWDVILLPTWLGLATILTMAVARCFQVQQALSMQVPSTDRQ
jgi:hypothetical protein